MSLRKEQVHTRSLSLAPSLHHNVSQSFKNTPRRQWPMARSSTTQIPPSPTLPSPSSRRKWTPSLSTLELGELQTEQQPPLPELKALHQLLELLTELATELATKLHPHTAHECEIPRHLRDLSSSYFPLFCIIQRNRRLGLHHHQKFSVSDLYLFCQKSFSCLVLSVALVCLFR